MNTMYIAFSGTFEGGHKLGDCITMVKACYLFVENEPHDKIILSLNPRHKLNFLWKKFIDKYDVQVVYDDFPLNDKDVMYKIFHERRITRRIQNIKFDSYKELYLRVEGGKRQKYLCGEERGLGRKNIFEYYYFGQENKPEKCIGGDNFKNNLIYYTPDRNKIPKKSVFVSPLAVSQGNSIFTFDFWKEVVKILVEQDIFIFLNTNQINLFEDIKSEKIEFTYENTNDFETLLNRVASQQLVVCGNTGVGWFAGATGTPLMAMEPPFFWFMDYRYKECGVESLKKLFAEPNPNIVSNSIVEYLNSL